MGVVALVLVAAMLLWSGGDNGELASDGPAPGVQPVAVTQSPDSLPLPAAPATPDAPIPPLAPSAPGVAAGERIYPSLPDALTEPPVWLGEDVPFDVEEYFAAPPPDRNAAPLYLDALFEFADEMAPCFCPAGGGTARGSETPSRGRR